MWYQFTCKNGIWTQIGTNAYATHDEAMNDTPTGYFQMSGDPWWVCQKNPSSKPQVCNSSLMNAGFNDICPAAYSRPFGGCRP
jgi:hypothetical protein